MEDDGRSNAPARFSGPGRVIKGGTSPDSSGEKAVGRPAQPRAAVVNAEEFEARQASRGIIEEAQRKAAEIIDEANQQKADIFEKSREEARQEVLAQASEELARAKMQVGQMIEAAESQVVALALDVAAKIVGRDLERDPELLLEIAATAAENVRHTHAMVLRVNPRDGAMLREKRPKLMELLGRTVDLAIRDDADVEAGGCIIQTEFGTIDAQLKTQFEMLKNVLLPDAGRKEGPK